MEQIVSKDDIKQWIYQKQNFEIMLEDYYLQTGKNYPIDKIELEASKKTVTTSIGYLSNTDLKSIHSGYQELKETLVFSETDWIHPFMDVAVHKHPRYFPAFKHFHAFYEMCYVLDGECMQTIYSGDSNHEITLKTGDILIIPPHLCHSVSMNSDSSVVNILIRQSTFEYAFLNNIPTGTALHRFFFNTLHSPDQNNYIVCRTGVDEELKNHFFNISEEYCNYQLYSNSIINAELAIFLSKLLRNHSASMSFAGQFSNNWELILSIMQYVESNYATATVQTIAAHFGFNATYLSRIFKSNTGEPLINVLVKTRLTKAAEYLELTNLSIDSITEHIGYNDVTYFIRAFKKQYGKTPLQYRKSGKK